MDTRSATRPVVVGVDGSAVSAPVLRWAVAEALQRLWSRRHLLGRLACLDVQGVVVPFRDRADAGRRLAVRLRHLRGEDVVVLGLPRGGVPVAAEVARVLDAPLDVIVVRKLGMTFQPELAMGAVGEGSALIVNHRVVRQAHVSEAEFVEAERRERAEVERRALQFRGDRPRLALEGRTALVVDDGIATGSTARAACRVARAQGAARVVLAAPVCSPDTACALRDEVDELVCLETPRWFSAVGRCYTDFRPTADGEVAALLQQAAQRLPAAAEND